MSNFNLPIIVYNLCWDTYCDCIVWNVICNNRTCSNKNIITNSYSSYNFCTTR